MLNLHNVFDSEPETTTTTRGMIRPITTEELLDGTNTLPARMAPAVDNATEHIQTHIKEQNQLNGGKNDDGLDKQIKKIREGNTEDREDIATKLDNLVIEWNRLKGGSYSTEELRWVRCRVQDRFLGYDAVEPFMRDPRITEILITAPAPQLVKKWDEETGTITQHWDGGTRVEIGGKLVPAPGVIFGDGKVLQLATDVLLPKSTTSVSEPIQSGMLPNKTRVEVRHPILGSDTFIALRRHPLSAWTLKMLIDNGTISEELACDLATYKRDRYNLVISGSTGSGKSSLANALLGFVNPDHHILLVEDTPELNPPGFVFATRAITRPSKGEMRDIGISELMRSSLRSRPEILAVGECRGGEMAMVLRTMRSGHHGSFTTLHADSASDTIIRMEDMLDESGEGSGNFAHKIASSVDLIIFQSRLPDGSRKVVSILEITKPDRSSTKKIEEVEFRTLWDYDYETGTQVKVADVSDELRSIRHVTNPTSVTIEEVNRIHELSQR
jgi:Flp pilus assembly CpaF family ATPase